jgi:branched-chain amino acid transport system permease protein
MAIFAMSLGLIMGYAGLVSLGHAAFFGIGAYTVAILGDYVGNTYLLLLAAVVLAALIAFISGYFFIRVSQFYFLMITLAFGQLLYAVIWQMKPITGGADGRSVSPVLNFGWGEIIDPEAMYYVMAVIFTLVYLILRLFVYSPMGQTVKGVMENESRMKMLGYNADAYKLVAYTLSGAVAGVAGAFYAYYNVFVSPELVDWLFSGQVLVMVIVGGMGTLFGPAIGAGFFVVLQNYMSTYTERWMLIMGLIFIIFVLVGRGGIIHLLMDLWQRIRPGQAHRRKADINQSESGGKS